MCVVLSFGSSRPDTVLVAIMHGAFGSWFGLSETLLRTVPILLCALAAAIPAEAGQINIGGEGQFLLGAIGATLASSLAFNFSDGLTRGAMVLAALAFGAFWSAIPGLLRAKVGVNEALVTLFLNYVAFQILQFVVHGPLRDPNSMGWPMSRALPPGLQVSGIGGTRLHTGLLVAVICALLSVILIRYTRFGIELRSVGMSPTAAVNVGIAVRLYLLASMVVGGALAGLAGYYEIAAVQHRLRTDISLGFGYSGFLVAWMCKGRLWFLFPMSLLVAGLISSSEVLQISTGLPAATADVLEGLLLLFVLVGGSTLVRMSRHKAERQAMEAASGI